MLPPSGSFSVAFLSKVFSLSRRPQAGDDIAEPGRVHITAPAYDVPQVVVRQLEQLAKARQPVLVQPARVALHEPFQHQVELEQPPAAFPLQPIVRNAVNPTARRTSISLILPIASAGLRFFGQASVQFMIV